MSELPVGKIQVGTVVGPSIVKIRAKPSMAKLHPRAKGSGLGWQINKPNSMRKVVRIRNR